MQSIVSVMRASAMALLVFLGREDTAADISGVVCIWRNILDFWYAIENKKPPVNKSSPTSVG